MDGKFDEAISLAGDNHRYQYISLILTICVWSNVDLIPISLPFLERQPEIIFQNGSATAEFTNLNYTICELGNSTYNITKEYGYSWISEYKITCDKIMTGLIGTTIFLGVMLGSLTFKIINDRLGRKMTTLFGLLVSVITVIGFIFCYNLIQLIILNFIRGWGCCLIGLSSYLLVTEIVCKDKRAIFGGFINTGFSICGIIYIILFKYLENWRWIILVGGCFKLLFGLLYLFYITESPRYYSSRGDYDNFYKIFLEIAKKNNRYDIVLKEINSENSKYKTLLEDIKVYIKSNMSHAKDIKNKTYICPQEKEQLKQATSRVAQSNDTLEKGIPREFRSNGPLEKRNLKEDQLNDFHEKENSREAKNNGTSLKEIPEIVKKIDTLKKEKEITEAVLQNGNIFSLLTCPQIRYKFLILCFLWFSISGNYYGLTIYLKTLPGDIYLNGIIIYIFEGFSYFIAGFLTNIECLGRKKTLIIFYVIAILGFLFSLTLKLEGIALIVLTFISRFAVAGIFNILYVYSLENYSTDTRAIGFGINTAFSRLGSICFPLIMELMSEYIMIVFIIFNGASLLFMFFMGETYGKPLPENLKQIELKDTRGIAKINSQVP